MERALQGQKILDLSMNLPGPYMTWLLAQLGADVVKVENPSGGDYARVLGGPKGSNSPFFEAVNRNKRSLALNLKHPDGQSVFLELLDTFDVLVEGFRPGAMEKLGLDFETLGKRQPRLIQVSISGYGQHGPFRERAGHDMNYLALAGIIGMTGTRGGEPAVPGIQIADLAGGSLMALTGLLAAIIQRHTTGRGQFVDVSMFHGSLSLATMVYAGVAAGFEKARPGQMLLNGRFPCYGLYETKDGRWMSLGAIEYKFWSNFCQAVDRPDLAGEQYGGPEAVAKVEAIFASKTYDEWVDLMSRWDACCEPVLHLEEAVGSGLVAARDMHVQSPTGVTMLGSPLALSDSAATPAQPAPRLGEHSLDVLAEAGISGKRVDALVNQGIIARS
jgi:crotonobetainyl-CoA:carnitine CoA-transferase CaiB-like acyl-CoA transferase